MNQNDLLTTATIAAHAQFADSGFRQKEVRFFADLFSNWIDTPFEPSSSPLHNTQISRFLQNLNLEGLAKKRTKEKFARYSLNRVGLIELTRILSAEKFRSKNDFFFIYNFFKSYKILIYELIKKEGTQFPRALQIEFEDLFNPNRLLDSQISAVEKELRRLDARIEDTQKAMELFRERRLAGESLEKIIGRIEEGFPYELNSQRPISELFKNMRPEQQEWELTTANQNRLHFMWKPRKNILQTYLDTLRDFRKN